MPSPPMPSPNVTTAALLAANEAFYDAFDSGDMAEMAALWAAEHPVACLHPGAPPIHGREAVLESWRAILATSSRPAIQCLQPEALLFHEAGLVICVEALAGGPPSQDELDRAWTSTRAQVIRGLEELGGFGGKADTLDYYNHHTGDPGYLAKDFERYETATPAGVQAAFAAAIHKNNRVVVTVVPAPKQEGGAQ